MSLGIGIISDLHMEFSPWSYDFKKDFLYINAGDTHPPRFTPSHQDILAKSIREAGSQYFEVLGNHDFYGGGFPKPGENQYTAGIAGHKIAGCTLWTKLSPVEFVQYKYSLADYSHISGLTYEAYRDAHDSDLQFIIDSNADVVVTHHSPSVQSCHQRWRGSGMDHFFHNNYDNIIRKLRPRLWIHGHTHDNADYNIGNCRVVCHPRGYPRERHHIDYIPKEIVI